MAIRNQLVLAVSAIALLAAPVAFAKDAAPVTPAATAPSKDHKGMEHKKEHKGAHKGHKKEEKKTEEATPEAEAK